MEPDSSLAKALDECLAMMREGKSVDVCLAANTEMHDQVEPLLYTGQFISTLPKAEPSEEFRSTARGRLMARLQEEANQARLKEAEAKPAVSILDDVTTNVHQLWQVFAGARRVALPVALGLILIIVSAVSAINFMSPSPALAEGCTLSIISGTVEVQAPAVDDKVQGTDGMTLNVGTRVKTAQDSMALLTFFDGSTLTLEPGAEIEIQQLQSDDEKAVTIVLKQWMGRTWSQVVKMVDKGSRYEIETPSAVALVRGTRFSLEVDEEGNTTEQTSEGLVSVFAQGEEVFVPAGQATIVEPGTTPSEPMVSVTPVYQPQAPAEEQSQVPAEEKPDNSINQNAPPAYGWNNAPNSSQGIGNVGNNIPDQGNSQGQGQVNNNAGGNDLNDKNSNDNARGNVNDTEQDNGQDQSNHNAVDVEQHDNNIDDKGQSNSNDNDRGNGDDKGQSNNNDNDRGNGDDSDRGNSGDSDQGNGNDNDWGNGGDNDRGNGNDNDRGNGSDNGQGNGSDNSQGNGNDNSQGNGSDSAQGNGNDNDRGNGGDNDRGNSNNSDRGNGNDNDRGNGSDNGQGNGGDNVQGNGGDNAQGNGSNNGQGNGHDSERGQGNDNDHSNGNNSGWGNRNDGDRGNGGGDNDRGNGNNSDRGNGNDNDRGNGSDNGQGNGHDNANNNNNNQGGTKDKKS